MKFPWLKTISFFLLTNLIYCQEISLFQQFNGHYDYLAIGNTLNEAENNGNSFCEILPQSSANLNLDDNSNIVAAYLYWAGSGSGDLDITLNDTDFTATETYTVDYEDAINGTLTYFSCFADITEFILENGNIDYTLSNLDLSEVLESNPGYCANRTNFAGWSIYVVFEDETLPLNQINLFQGLEIINRNVQEKTIYLEDVNILDNEGAKIGFLAWEGDTALNYGESLFLNGNLLSNPPLNPSNNAFNGTNSFNNSSELYNCDIDFYNIQNYINIGDTTVEITLTTGDYNENGNFAADLIILNNIITVLNSQLPDATTDITEAQVLCGNQQIALNFYINNFNATDYLPANTQVSIYADNTLLDTVYTYDDIEIGESEYFELVIDLPSNFENYITITVMADDIGDGTGIVTELNETNNFDLVGLEISPFEILELDPMKGCDLGFNKAFFNLVAHIQDLPNYSESEFFTSLDDLFLGDFEIIDPENYQNSLDPEPIFVKIPSDSCFNIYTFDLTTENCPPYIPEVFTPNGDGYNDWFNIQGLYNIFENHNLLIYNRYGTLIFEGNNHTKWFGEANKGLNNLHKPLPTGTYFYILNLNDPAYDILTGWVYLTR
ncbi:T9SS type B sorting domain-containing protein [Mangrovimonas sp. CR14]|uniref:gliding motility-associated C-terminal domain-containing protein n=1 Tax=Mangrovimonas sp. CR14 TaxID=2706120 RepID=UPI0014208DC8|nr:gliding motility-associated C-terminal domain-containing protein [Mangrovimonas sp. CR14]NIK92667.1 T9SS type B sorting domain-containing protein [Mangrovimonas sp. CR14]